jgi:dTMP kinase
MKTKSFYGKGLPHVIPSDLTGALLVIEGADGSGRSTQARLLRDWLERLGYPTTEVGLKRSELVGEELEAAMQGNVLGPTTLSLFYATDFADQLENRILSALRAGFVVVADRYIYTLMARDAVRGAPRDWIRDVYGIAVKPDMVLFLDVPPRTLVERSFQKQGELDYWESGMDIQRSGDMYQCFIRYQASVRKEFEYMKGEYGFEVLDGTKEPLEIHAAIQQRLKKVLKPARAKKSKQTAAA